MSGTVTPSAEDSEQSLNEEVSQVIGQLGRFWGGLRKQSQSALQLARKDLGEVVSQAQRELGRLTGEAARAEEGHEDPLSEAQDKEIEGHAPGQEEEEGGGGGVAGTSSSSILSRLQSALPEGLDLVQLRTTLSSEFQRVQGVTMAQAGEYVQRSEGLLREVLRDAVKVVPPEDAKPGMMMMMMAPGPLWDGVDMWPDPVPSSSSSSSAVAAVAVAAPSDGEGQTSSKKSSARQQVTAMTRAETLLKQLKSNAAIMRQDPEADDRVREVYRSWVEREVEDKGGMEGDEWTRRISAALDEGEDGQALKASMDSLVPSELTKEQFWKRYWFRVEQIDREEEKRRALLQGTREEEEVSWEDEEEGGQTPRKEATRQRGSEDSYDLAESDSDWE